VSIPANEGEDAEVPPTGEKYVPESRKVLLTQSGVGVVVE
jgi:hypothetical protein